MLDFLGNTLIARLIYALKISRSIEAWKLGIPQEITALHHAGRNTKEWRPHLENCKSEILKFLESQINRNQASRVLIFGSGALNDVPAKEILERFPNVTLELIDLAHPDEAKKMAETHSGRVLLTTADITGTLGFITPLTFDELRPQTQKSSAAIFCISLNVLSQLPLFPLKKKRAHLRRDLEEREEKNLALPLLENHLKTLEQARASLLITDLQWNDSTPLEAPLYGLALALKWQSTRENWKWSVHPKTQTNTVGSFVYKQT